ncbi:MAG: DUF484 family protein [Pseudomonadota bacterium]
MPNDLLAENQILRARLAELVEQAARNHQIMQRHQSFDLEIIGAGNFTGLISSIFYTLPDISELDIVTLALLDQGGDIHHVMGNLGVDFDEYPQLIFVDKEESLGNFHAPAHGPSNKPVMGLFQESIHRRSFPLPLTTPMSVAIVPLLRNKRLIGSLNLGSLDPNRFSNRLGTDYVEHMASIIAICLENVISNELLKYIGLTDPLTGVYNRRYVDRRLLEEIGRARRQRYDVSCMYIDIDHFKQVNDSVGHQGGDEVLCEVAERIKAELRLADTMGRYGGEEFVALLVNAKREDAIGVAERIRSGIAALPFKLSSGDLLDVTASIGVAVLHDTNPAEAIEAVAQRFVAQADQALYEAKERGRNRVVSIDAS